MQMRTFGPVIVRGEENEGVSIGDLQKQLTKNFYHPRQIMVIYPILLVDVTL